MPLTPGEKLGPYEILSPLGAGGMGEVYKARDARLDRLVALKTCAQRFNERFQREAQAIASLNHPHICTLYDVGPDYLVMELIEGQPLRGPLPVAEALRLAVQIAEALSEAHRRGIVHRDLKPANIMVAKSGVKVLDFGLAKLSRAAASGVPEAAPAATLTQRVLTQEGSLLGTPQYMAPEQLEGREADARSDVFAFGLVLYEMLTGLPAFTGKSPASLIAAILAAEPAPLSSIQPLAPPALGQLLKTCLAKDPDERRQSMHDVLLELRWIAEGASQTGVAAPSAPRRKRREWLAWSAAAVSLALAAALAFVHFQESPPARELVRFQFHLPQGVQMGPADVPVVSPDGRSVVVPGTGGGKRQLYLRRLDGLETKVLPNTEDAGQVPFWSPDGNYIGFVAEGRLTKMEVNGGGRLALAAATDGVAASWGLDGTIVFAKEGSLYRVSSSGGNESLFLQPDASRKELGLFAPSFLPDGRGILYAVYSVDPAVSGIYTVSLEAKQPRRLAGTIALPLFAPPHYLVFGRQQSLLALALADGWSRPEGEASVILDNVRAQSAAPRSYSVSRTGVLAFRENRGGALLQFAWYDRTGRRTGVLGAPERHLQFQVSPDGRRLAVHGAEVSGRSVVRELSLTSGILAPLAALGIQMDNAAWSPDGREVILSATEKASMNLYRKTVGGGPPSLVLESPENKYVEQWLPDGSILFLNVNGRTFYRLPMAPGAKPEALLTTEYSKDEPQVSPDGRWIVYGANESGVWEVYVAGFPSFEQRRQLSGGGGMQPKWRQDGKEIFYLTPDGVLTAVAFRPGSPPDSGAPQALFKTRVAVMPTRDQYEVLDGGRRFLVLEAEHSSDEPVSVILNWQALLAARPR